jgi:HEAT repeat protein
VVDQVEIHRKAASDDVEERIEAADRLRSEFANLPDKEEAWNDLIRLTQDEDSDVQDDAAGALGFAFQYVSDKGEAWENLIRLTQADDWWRMSNSVKYAIGDAFPFVPDKEQAWNDLHRLTQDESERVRSCAATILGLVFPYIPDKAEAWDDLISLSGDFGGSDHDSDVRRAASSKLGSVFQYVPDKNKAWADLQYLNRYEDSEVWENTAEALVSSFSQVNDKDKTWADLIEHIQYYNRNRYARRSTFIYALGTVFPYIPDKNKAGEDLHQLAQNKDINVRCSAVDALGSAFSHIPDKKQAWDDLHRLTQEKDPGARWRAAGALGRAFQHIPDKDEAWDDLHRLTQEKDPGVRWGAAGALGRAFQHIPDKDEAWEVLHRLTEDENSSVRQDANHSLGRVSIFKATKAEEAEEFENELNKAIKFFEISSRETPYYNNPSRFCLPFYRSFYTITFKKSGTQDEVQKYLAEAKSASKGSANKETLLEAVENLANALSEAQKVTDFDATKSNLKAYMQYCNRAADLIGTAEEGAPGAALVLRRGLPIIDDRIKELIHDIQERAGAVCKDTRGTGTPYEPLGMEVNKWAGELSDRDYLRNEKNVSRIVHILGEFCNFLPEDKRKYPCKIVEEIREESELEDKLSSIATAFSYLQPCIESQLQNAAEPTTDEMRSDKQPSVQKTGHSTTVFAGAGSNITVTQTETESGDVTATTNANATKELQPEEHRTDHRKKLLSKLLPLLQSVYL